MRALGAADAAEGAVTLFFIEEALGIHGWTGALLLAHLLIRSFAWGAGSVANMGHGRAASPSWGIRQHWRNAY